MDRFAAHADANRERYVAELCELLRQPSIAAQGIGIEETAALVARRLERLGAEVRILRLDQAGASAAPSMARHSGGAIVSLSSDISDC